MAIGFLKKEVLILIFILPLFKKTDCHERFNYKTLRLSWNCQPIVNRLSCIPCGLSSSGASFSRFSLQIRPFFAFLTSNPTISRVLVGFRSLRLGFQISMLGFSTLRLGFQMSMLGITTLRLLVGKKTVFFGWVFLIKTNWVGPDPRF